MILSEMEVREDRLSLDVDDSRNSNDDSHNNASPISTKEPSGYGSDSSSSSCRDYQRQTSSSKDDICRNNNSATVSVTNAFSIDSILGRNQRCDTDGGTDGEREREEDEQDDREIRVWNQFVRPTAISASHSGN